MRLLLDECAGGRQLAKKLEAAGHDVARVVLTFNNRDFDAIGKANPNHAGLVRVSPKALVVRSLL